MRYLTKDELSAILSKASPEDRLMFLLAFNHGLRVSEVLGLTAENFVDGHLIVQRLKGSCKTAQRVLSNEASLLAKHKISECGKLFPITRMTAHRRIKRLGIAAGIPAFKCFTHALKHSTAVLGLKGGMTLPEVQTRLGHKSGASTMVYLKIDDEIADKAFEKAMTLSA